MRNDPAHWSYGYYYDYSTSKLSEEDAAWACVAWASGVTQRRIAINLGLKRPAPVCGAIRAFIRKWTPELPKHFIIYHTERQKLALEAVKRYRQAATEAE